MDFSFDAIKTLNDVKSKLQPLISQGAYYDPGNPKFTSETIPQMIELIEASILSQAEMFSESTQSYDTLTPDAQKTVEAMKKSTIDYITDRVCKNMAASTLKEIFEQQETTISPTTAGIRFADARKLGGDFGEFIEFSWFGLMKDNKPIADLDEIMTEIKASVGTAGRDLQGGGVTIRNLDKNPSQDQMEVLKDIMLLYKMIKKMQNLLLVRAEPTEYGKGHIKEILLYMILLVKKLYMHHLGLLRGKKIVTIQRKAGGGWSEKEKRVSYDIKLSLEKIFDTYRLSEIYLIEVDVLDKMRGDYGTLFRDLDSIKLHALNEGMTFGEFIKLGQ